MRVNPKRLSLYHIYHIATVPDDRLYQAELCISFDSAVFRILFPEVKYRYTK